jgi:hypothetical protein
VLGVSGGVCGCNAENVVISSQASRNKRAHQSLKMLLQSILSINIEDIVGVAG